MLRYQKLCHAIGFLLFITACARDNTDDPASPDVSELTIESNASPVTEKDDSTLDESESISDLVQEEPSVMEEDSSPIQIVEMTLSTENWDNANQAPIFDMRSDSAGTSYIGTPGTDNSLLEAGGIGGTNCGMFRSSNGSFTTVNPFLLASGSFFKVRIEFAYRSNFVDEVDTAILQYSKSGNFDDTINIKTFVTANVPTGDQYQVNVWHQNQKVELVNGENGVEFSDTAKIRWLSKGFAMSTRNWVDDIVVIGLKKN